MSGMTESSAQMREMALRITGRGRFSGLRRGRDVREVFDDARQALIGTPEKKQRLIRFAKFGLPPLVILLAIVGYFIFRPVPKPDYMTADISRVFNFTFLTDEFNRLPVEERVELIGQLLQRMNSMSASESAIMAGFAAGIAGTARKQLEENTARLMIDVWDKYAVEYARVQAEDREAYLDHAMVDLMKMMEAMGGRPRDISDADRLSEVQRQARRDQEMMRGERGPPPEAMGRMLSFMQTNIGSRASPAQRVRAQQLMVDMTRRVRGEPLSGRR